MLNIMERWSLGWSWGTEDDDLGGMLISIARHLGPLPLSIIMRQLAEDYRHSTSGMPDLILWREHGYALPAIGGSEECQ